MPNWVINRLILEGENAAKILKSHLMKDEEGEDQFDFNTLIKMPEELNIEKSSKSSDGLKLYLAKLNPLISSLGTKEDKIIPFENFNSRMLEIFKNYPMGMMNQNIINSKEIEEFKKKYPNDFNEVMDLGEKVFHNMETYGFPDWYDWRLENWGVKWNARHSEILRDDKTIYFDTAWGPSVPAIRLFAAMHPDLKIIHEYAQEETGFYSGRHEYINGEVVLEKDYDSFSKEAYEMSFDLWGENDSFIFDPKVNNYVYKEEMEAE